MSNGIWQRYIYIWWSFWTIENSDQLLGQSSNNGTLFSGKWREQEPTKVHTTANHTNHHPNTSFRFIVHRCIVGFSVKPATSIYSLSIVYYCCYSNAWGLLYDALLQLFTKTLLLKILHSKLSKTDLLSLNQLSIQVCKVYRHVLTIIFVLMSHNHS